MKIDIKDYIVEEKKSKKAALADMGLTIDDTARVGRFQKNCSSFFWGEDDNCLDGERLANEDYEDIADCGDEWYLD